MGYGYGSHWGMMGWGHHGFWPFGMLFWLIIIVGIIALIAWALTSWRARNEGAPPSSALEVLEQRYARGEIGRDEYQQKKTDILRR